MWPRRPKRRTEGLLFHQKGLEKILQLAQSGDDENLKRMICPQNHGTFADGEKLCFEEKNKLTGAINKTTEKIRLEVKQPKLKLTIMLDYTHPSPT